jgi:hypothetical protein
MKILKAKCLPSYLVFLVFLAKLEAQIATNYHIYNTPETEFANQICYTPNGDLFVGGYTGSNQEAKAIFLKKMQEPGLGQAVIWHKEYDNPAIVENLRDMKVAPDGNLLLLVEQRITWNLSELNTANCQLIKINPDGEVLWKTTFNGGYKDIPIGIELRSDGSYLVLGFSNSHTGNNSTDEFLWLPISADGVLGTPKYVAISPYAPIIDVTSGSDGSVYAFNGFKVFKLDANANTLWEHSVGENLADKILTRIYIKQDGSILIAGSASIPATPEKLDAILLQYSADGAFLWQQSYGDDGIEIIEALIVCEEEGKIVCIGQDTPDDLVLIDGFYFLVTDMAGNELSSTTIGGDSPSFELGLDLAHTMNGRVVAAGVSTTFGTRDVMLLYTEDAFFSCSPPGTISATTETEQGSFRISPNPSVGDFWVIQADEALFIPSQFLLFNAFGQLVHTQKIDESENEISGLKLTPGLYFYSINQENRSVYTGKLVVTGD